MSDTLTQVQKEAWEWTQKNFPGQEPWQPLLGVAEEVGELCHAFLKLSQGIRGAKEEHLDSIEDAIGDILIFLVNFSSHLHIDVSTALQKTWNEVRERDWVKNPEGPKQVPAYDLDPILVGGDAVQKMAVKAGDEEGS